MNTTKPHTTYINRKLIKNKTLVFFPQGNSYDCCHRFYGSPEYPMLVEPDGSSYRAIDKYLFADEAEVLSNTAIVDKEGIAIATANSRFADDEIVIDDSCTAAGVPDGLSCVGFRQKMQRCGKVARCVDNNQTVRARVFVELSQSRDRGGWGWSQF